MSYSFEAPVKDPQASLQYEMDWSNWLADGDVLTAAQVLSDSADLVITEVSVADGIVRWRASGGLAGANYIVTCRISSVNDADERSVLYRVRER